MNWLLVIGIIVVFFVGFIMGLVIGMEYGEHDDWDSWEL